MTSITTLLVHHYRLTTKIKIKSLILRNYRKTCTNISKYGEDENICVVENKRSRKYRL
jgi:hypothetical protein